MRRQLTWLAIFPLLFSSWTFADVVHLKDGTTREGTIVSRTDTLVVLEVAIGNVRGRVTIAADLIGRIERKPTEQQQFRDEYAKRLARLDAKNADDVIDLASWARSNRMFAEAETLLLDLSIRDTSRFAQAMTELADMAWERKSLANASRYLDAALRDRPGFTPAVRLSKRIARDEEQRYARLIAEAVERFNAGSYKAALEQIERIYEQMTPEQRERVLAKASFPEDLNFDEFAAEARLRNAERAGKRIGVVPDWQRASIAHLLDERLQNGVVDFNTQIARLLRAEDAKNASDASIERVERSGGFILKWLDERERIPGPGFSVPLPRRADIDERLRSVYAHAGKLHAQQVMADWQRMLAGGGSFLPYDAQLRELQTRAQRASELLARARTKEAISEDFRRLVADVDAVVARNRKLLDAYERARKALAGDSRTIQVIVDSRAGNDKARAALVEIVENASAADLAYLSGLLEREFGRSIRELIEDTGRTPADGYVDPYGEDDPVERLLAEADEHAWEACKIHRLMWRFKEAGKAAQFPIILVHRAREHAKEAQRLYGEVLDGPYRIPFKDRQEILEQIDLMADIIAGTWEWYKDDGRNPRPDRYRRHDARQPESRISTAPAHPVTEA